MADANIGTDTKITFGEGDTLCGLPIIECDLGPGLSSKQLDSLRLISWEEFELTLTYDLTYDLSPEMRIMLRGGPLAGQSVDIPLDSKALAPMFIPVRDECDVVIGKYTYVDFNRGMPVYEYERSIPIRYWLSLSADLWTGNAGPCLE